MGETIKPIAISDYLLGILAKLQADLKKNNINIHAILDKYKADKVDRPRFAALLREGDPTLTSY